jgi:TonB family protein
MATPPGKFHVPEPCSEKWEQMQPTERGAFCASCSKNLYDFTKMTDAEITSVIRNSTEKVCGRFRNDQLVPPHQLPAVTISAMRNAPQVRQFLYVLWMVFGLSLFSCTPETESGITLGAMRTADTVQVDTLGVKGHNVKCAPVDEIIVVEGTTVGEMPPPEIYTTAGIPELPPETPVIDSVVTFADQPAQFPGGDKAMMSYLAQQIRYPEMAKEANIEGTVYVEFTVHTDGKISNVRLLRGIGYGCDEEAMRAVKNLPGFKPAVMGGRKVPMLMRLPVRFRLS